MSTHQVHVFISHSWWYSNHYDKLATWIFGEPWSAGQASIKFHDHSIPRDAAINNAPNDATLKAAIHDRIGRSHVVVIPTGMYAHYSKWIRKEIDSAKALNKPILAVNPWGALRTASVVATAAAKVVGWNKVPVVEAIWDLHYRGV